MNILLITLDQFRGDCLGSAGHPQVRTPNLDSLADEGVRFSNHFGQCAPCGPGRASLYTGLYQFNHRVVANGTPLDRRFDNIAKAARRAGYVPTLFGYTDQSIDPRDAFGPNDPRLQSYVGILPGFEVGYHIGAGDPHDWIEWLRCLGHHVPNEAESVLRSEGQRPAEHSLSAFLTNQLLHWLPRQHEPWFVHLSQFRPHPPFAAAGEFSELYDPQDVELPIAPSATQHWLHQILLSHPLLASPKEDAEVRQMRAQYYGMVTEADAQLGRVFDWLKANGQWDDTLIIFTSDHGEHLGDHGLIQKFGFFEQSVHIPAIIRDPRYKEQSGRVVEAFTESIDIFPTLCEAMGIDIPSQCDGLPLTYFLKAETPPWWRKTVHWEFDWRFDALAKSEFPWPWMRQLESQSLIVERSETYAYVHFGDGSWICFDLETDPSWRTPVTNSLEIQKAAQNLLTWRLSMNERTLSSMLIERGGIGRWPPMPDQWETGNFE